MRITGGRARSIPLKVPTRGEIRPSTDYLREAVFSSLGAFVNDAAVLDVFAGTGAYGLEAISRGAGSVVFVEKNAAATAVINQNIAAVSKALGNPAIHARAITGDATAPAIIAALTGQLHSVNNSVNLLFFDPPWALWERGAAAGVARIVETFAAADALLVLEAPGDATPPFPAGWQLRRRLAKGKDQPAAFILEHA